jgi:hypothetical protein
MTKRLQVLLDEHELREMHRMARAERMTLAEWVRQVPCSAWWTRSCPSTDTS